jgi:multidrug efflux pump
MWDRTVTIRASVQDVQYTLLITIALVLLVVFVFMRRVVPTVAAAVTVPLSISGTLTGMWFISASLFCPSASPWSRCSFR